MSVISYKWKLNFNKPVDAFCVAELRAPLFIISKLIQKLIFISQIEYFVEYYSSPAQIQLEDAQGIKLEN